MKTQRIAELEKTCAQRGQSKILSHFLEDYHSSALTKFSHCEPWEKAARAMAYAIENQEIYVYPEDRIGGRVYHNNEVPVTCIDPELDGDSEAAKAFAAEYPEAAELVENQLIGSTSKGHITWFFHRILTMGLTGFKAQYEHALLHAKDQEAEHFYKGVIILLDALQNFNDKHIEAYEKIGNSALAERMKKVPRYPAETFRDAVQAFFMQHIVVMKENPYGGNGPGRLDYYLWPYLERDIKAGRCTLSEAREIIDELFLRIDERIYGRDIWVEAIVVGGTNPDGSSAINPLTYIADKGLENYADFESFYGDFIAEAKRLTEIYLRKQDIYSQYTGKARPSYLISSMIDDCLARGRNMHAGGARYHDYGSTPLALPNVADGLYAIKQAVFEKKICTAAELVAALKADFKGYEQLQAKLKALPKYGIDNDEVDALTARLYNDFSDLYLNYSTRWGGKGKPIILTFIYSPMAAAILGATPDGRNAGKQIAHGVTPHSASMTEGITAAINSCGKLPYGKFSGGASTMWDFDSSWASESLIAALIKTFCSKNCQIFQGNTTPVEDLLDAQKNPDDHKNLIVRVGGYSARFVNLSAELQNEIIGRIRHVG